MPGPSTCWISTLPHQEDYRQADYTFLSRGIKHLLLSIPDSLCQNSMSPIYKLLTLPRHEAIQIGKKGSVYETGERATMANTNSSQLAWLHSQERRNTLQGSRDFHLVPSDTAAQQLAQRCLCGDNLSSFHLVYFCLPCGLLLVQWTWPLVKMCVLGVDGKDGGKALEVSFYTSICLPFPEPSIAVVFSCIGSLNSELLNLQIWRACPLMAGLMHPLVTLLMAIPQQFPQLSFVFSKYSQLTHVKDRFSDADLPLMQDPETWISLEKFDTWIYIMQMQQE